MAFLALFLGPDRLFGRDNVVSAPAVGAVEFAVDTKGDVTVASGGQFASLLGTYSVSCGVTPGLRQRPDETLVSFRQAVAGQMRDTVFTIPTRQPLDVVLNGRFSQRVENQRVVIEVRQGSSLRVRLEPSGPPRTPVKQTYQLAYTGKLLRLPDPGTNGGTQSIDLDTPQAGSKESFDARNLDLSWDAADGIVAENGVVFGIGATAKDRDNDAGCAARARSGSVRAIRPADLKLGMAFCVVTGSASVAWVQYTGDTGGALAFRVTLWRLGTALGQPDDYTGYAQPTSTTMRLMPPSDGDPPPRPNWTAGWFDPARTRRRSI
jgi:hypothetical protein